MPCIHHLRLQRKAGRWMCDPRTDTYFKNNIFNDIISARKERKLNTARGSQVGGSLDLGVSD